MIDRQEQLIEFHLVMGQPIEPRPTVPSDDRVRLRAKLIAEEFFETMRAMFGHHSFIANAEWALGSVIDRSPTNVDLVELADGLADLDYVVEGTRLEFGIDGDSIAEEVHKTNMAKLNGPINADGKRLKPPGWTPPRIAMLLDLQKEMHTLGDIAADWISDHSPGESPW